MSKVKAAGVLGALILCGLLALTSLAAAAGDNFLNAVRQAFHRGCIELAPHATFGDSKVFLKACFLFADAVPDLHPSDLNETVLNTTALNETLALIDAIGQKAPRNCDKCVEFVGDLESFLASNNTAADLEQALVLGCDRRFSDPAEAAQCRQIVGKTRLPELIDSILSNFPPIPLCQAVSHCPLESK